MPPTRVLVIRLDRIGDVVLSTPVLTALREQFPDAFIAMMVRPDCREVVDGHPALNALLLYDKTGSHYSVAGTIRFARALRRYRFDTALVLHPSYRSHWISWLAGIPVRIGYDRKGGWLLTHRLPHRKQEGTQHEAVYALECLAPLGIRARVARPFVPIQPDSAQRLETLLAAESVGTTDRLVALHPSASCVSKRWNPERFAQVADRLVDTQGVRICLVAGAGAADVYAAQTVAQAMGHPVVNLAGRLRVGELAALLRRACVLISNDSGPVHIAAAVGTPVVDLFGRNEQGLSPVRWGPLGEGHVVLHKEVGCVRCLAHRCDIGFLCLEQLSVEEVYQAAVAVLHRDSNDNIGLDSG